MIERICKKYVSCPVCGRTLMKCKGSCDIEITCMKCNQEIVVLSDDEKIVVLENRRGRDEKRGAGCVRVSLPRKGPYNRASHNDENRAVNF